MKVAVFSESSADEAAIRILVEGLLGEKTEFAPLFPIRGRGCDAVLANLASVLKHLHYRTDTDALVVVIDSDRSPVHQETHATPEGAEERCRLCRMAKTVAEVQGVLRPRQLYVPLKIALGLDVPQIEAWYLAGRDPHVGEAAWMVGLQSGKPPYTSDSLKREMYDTHEPPLALETDRAVREVQRIIDDGKLPLLEQLFPDGFGALARDVRNW